MIGVARLAAAVVAAAARLASGPGVRWADGGPGRGPCVFFANHTSHLDFVVLWSVLPEDLRARTRPVAARDYWDAGPVRRYLATRVFRALLVERDRASVGRLRAEIDGMVGALDAGDSLILFPEGTRGAGPGVGPFRGGLYALAHRRPGVDFVPVHLANLHRIMPKGEFLPAPQLARVSFGPPMRLLDGETKDAFLARARAAVAAAGAA